MVASVLFLFWFLRFLGLPLFFGGVVVAIELMVSSNGSG